MATYTENALVSISGAARQITSADDRQLGEVMAFANNLNIANANIDGWFSGIGTVIRTNGAVNYDISLGNAAPLGTLGTGAFLRGFTSNGKYAWLVYFELLTNTTGLGAGQAASLGKALDLHYQTGGAFILSMTNPGDCALLIYQNTSTAVASATPDYYVVLTGNATVTFKLVVLYRTAQYPV